jgi:hypothetical protein
MVLLPTLPSSPYLFLPCYLENDNENDPSSSSSRDKEGTKESCPTHVGFLIFSLF